jgi:hypothetical protein
MARVGERRFVVQIRGEASLARFEAQAAGKFGSMSRTNLPRIVNVNDRLFLAVILGGRHHAELSVVLKQRHRRHQHLGKIECVVLGKDEIVRHLLKLPFERGPSPLDRRPNVPGLTAITAEASADSGRTFHVADPSRVERIGKEWDLGLKPKERGWFRSKDV